MPLRDHFHSPLDDLMSWEGLHGGWPMAIVQSIARELPAHYVAIPRVHHGAYVEFDVSAYEYSPGALRPKAPDAGGVITAPWAPPVPTYSTDIDLAGIDEYEVRIYDTRGGRRLVSAIEIVSPANKDRPEHRRAFVGKCAALIQNHVSMVIVDLVTSRQFNLYHDLLDFIGKSPTTDTSGPIYAVSFRTKPKNGTGLFEAWGTTLSVGQPLPTLPLWLAEDLSMPLDLERSYEETCEVLRIP